MVQFSRAFALGESVLDSVWRSSTAGILDRCMPEYRSACAVRIYRYPGWSTADTNCDSWRATDDLRRAVSGLLPQSVSVYDGRDFRDGGRMARSVGRAEMEIRSLAWITEISIHLEAKVSHEIRKFCCVYERSRLISTDGGGGTLSEMQYPQIFNGLRGTAEKRLSARFGHQIALCSAQSNRFARYERH
jgi:hypothetical protein